MDGYVKNRHIAGNFPHTKKQPPSGKLFLLSFDPIPQDCPGLGRCAFGQIRKQLLRRRIFPPAGYVVPEFARFWIASGLADLLLNLLLHCFKRHPPSDTPPFPTLLLLLLYSSVSLIAPVSRKRGHPPDGLRLSKNLRLR